MTDPRHWRGNRIRLMYSAYQYHQDRLRSCAWTTFGAVVTVCGSLVWLYLRLPSVEAGSVQLPRSTPPGLQIAGTLPSVDWSVFHGVEAKRNDTVGGAADKRFRVAGMFFTYDNSETTEGSAVAVLDDLKKGEQVVAKEGGSIDEFQIVRIQHDSVVLRHAEYEETLWLSFSGVSGRGKVGGSGQASPVGEGVVDGTCVFGKRVGERSWVFSREKLLDYYQDLRDHPDRLVAVFDSMLPVYDAEHKIAGYELQVKGEGDFFRAVGLREGDIVRSVNTFKMTSRRRAEYMINEFVKDRLNVFLLDVERDGKPEKFEYRIR